MVSANQGPLRGAAFDALHREYLQAFEQAKYEDALALALRGTEKYPRHFFFWMQASICALYLRRWSLAAQYGEQALLFPGAGFSLFDSLAHAYGELKQADQVRRFGAMALAQRDVQFGRNQPVPASPAVASPAPPSPQTRAHNVIAFSLFGERSKYCECAVLNAVLCPEIYPDWHCVVYADDSVPAHVTQRLAAAGAEVYPVPSAATHWPGPMWRLLAADLPGVHRVIFRDADSLISLREAAAVAAWVSSAQRFHIIRDSGSHTELLLAGLWGMVAGALPSMLEMVNAYLASPVKSAHFADQWFLRDRVWPYARQSLLSHDSQFGFMDARPLSVAAPHAAFHVGSTEGGALATAKTPLPHGTAAHWTLWDWRDGAGRKQEVCCYPVAIQHGIAVFELPFYYAQMIRDGRMSVEVTADAPLTPSHTLSSFDELKQRFNTQFQARAFSEALALAQAGAQAYPESAYFWSSAALCCTRLRRWQDALRWGEQAVDKASAGFNLFDALAYAAWSLGDAERTRRYGARALALRDAKFGQVTAPPPLNRVPLPAAPQVGRVGRNVIAFSLFGALPKYLDTAVLNAQYCGEIYPGWQCRFYVDASVPQQAVARLRALGAQVQEVDAKAAQWPGAMWRLLAADDASLDRVLFRDADSVISQREADAVQAWVAAGQMFHTMRDAGSHTELIMAGMWGAVVGALPALSPMVETYLAGREVRGFARHYADQWFLRLNVWPYVRQSLCAHDSVFGFGVAQPFPTAALAPELHVGCCEGGYAIQHPTPWPEGTQVRWFAHAAGDVSQPLTLTHEAGVDAQGRLAIALPRSHALAWRARQVAIHVEAVQAKPAPSGE
jgi:tetratricopeptide (TPR) repeat protein